VAIVADRPSGTLGQRNLLLMLEIKLADVADYSCDMKAQDSVGGHDEVGGLSGGAS